MKDLNYSKLTTEELEKELKKSKKENIIRATIIGAFVGLSVYSTISKGFTFWTIFPFIFILIVQKNKSKEIKKELASRKND